jgi:hypothetical protein
LRHKINSRRKSDKSDSGKNGEQVKDKRTATQPAAMKKDNNEKKPPVATEEKTMRPIKKAC